MSDRKIITADQARQWVRHLEAAGMTGNQEYRHWTTITRLHEQVERQAAQIERLQEAVRQAEHYVRRGIGESDLAPILIETEVITEGDMR